MAYDNQGSLFALGMRLSKLNADGTIMSGSNTCYVTTSLIKASIGLDYDDPSAVSQNNGAGKICLYYQAPSTLKQATIKDLTICTPDPNVMAFVLGGTVYEGTGTPAPDLGYQAPAVGSVPNPNGLSLELWTNALGNGTISASLPYFHWILPRVQLKLSSEFTAEESNPLTPVFEGTGAENSGWGTGPAADFTRDASRVWQYLREATIPTLTPGFVTVA